MKPLIHRRIGLAAIVGFYSLAIARVDAQDSSGMTSVSLQDAISGSVPEAKRFDRPNVTAFLFQNMAMEQNRNGVSIGVSIGIIPADAKYVGAIQGPRPKGAFYYWFDDVQWINYRKNFKAGQVLLVPPFDADQAYRTGSNVARFFVLRVNNDSWAPTETDAVKIASVFEKIDKNPLKEKTNSESTLFTNHLFNVKLVQLKSAGTYTIKSPHPPLYMMVVHGPISLNGTKMEQDRIIAFRNRDLAVNLGNPGQKPAAVLEINVIAARAKRPQKPTESAPTSEQ